MFYLDPKKKSKLCKVTIPVNFKRNSIIPNDYAYAIGNAGNIQDAKGCSSTIDSIQPFNFSGNIQSTIQNDVQLIPPGNTIRFDGLLGPYQKPFKFYPIIYSYPFDMFIPPFSFDLSFTLSNRIYFTSILTKKMDLLDWQFDLWSWTTNGNPPLTFIPFSDSCFFGGIKMTSPDDSLIYGSNIYAKIIKNKHREAMAINDYSSMFSINKMHKIYAFSLKCKYVYVQNIVYVYIKNCLYGFKRTIVQRGVPGIRPREYI